MIYQNLWFYIYNDLLASNFGNLCLTRYTVLLTKLNSHELPDEAERR